MAKNKPEIVDTIEILIDYKKGMLTLDQAVEKMRKVAGLTPSVAQTFIKGMSRDNIISLEAKRKVLRGQE